MATNPYLARAQALQDQRWGDQTKFKLAPLSQALTADQTRLALYADPNDPSKAVAGKEKEYQQTLDNMTATIGQMRGILGEKQPGANPLEAAAGDVLSKLHITNHLKSHVAQVRAENAAKYEGQNKTMAGEYATAAMPYAQTLRVRRWPSRSASGRRRKSRTGRISRVRTGDIDLRGHRPPNAPRWIREVWCRADHREARRDSRLLSKAASRMGSRIRTPASSISHRS